MPESTRRTGRDVSILSVGGTSVLALYQECALTIRTPEVDVSGVKDNWQSIRLGRSEYALECKKFISGSPVFAGLAINRAQVAWSANIDGATRSGSGYLVSASAVASAGEIPESCTLIGDGAIA